MIFTSEVCGVVLIAPFDKISRPPCSTIRFIVFLSLFFRCFSPFSFYHRTFSLTTVDVLVNNAGILSLKKPFVEYTKADWDKIFGINFMGDVFFCKAVIPTMKEKKSGRIINMASQSAETGGLAASPIYAASKAAVWCMTKSLAGEMGPYQVTVNAVAPGYIMTEMTRNAGYRDDMVPMRRLGTPEDVADVVGFLASEDSRYVTGMIVDINGGTVMR
ncbi:MAG: SDR family NAD(P)-dependent oxidoreductase [Flavonifractor plautii]